MNRSGHQVALASLLMLALSAGAARAANTIVLPRAGQIGVGIQAQGGTLLSTGALGKEFGAGAGLAVHVRYRMRFERAMGLTLDLQNLKSRKPSGGPGGAFDSTTAPTDPPGLLRDRVKLATAGVEFYQMFDTRERTVKMLSAGAGLVQLSAHLNNGETAFPLAGDGVFVSAGGGLERFFFHSWAWDLGARYMAIFHDGKLNHDIQLQTGLIFYAAY
jgi:hypothetical protein